MVSGQFSVQWIQGPHVWSAQKFLFYTVASMASHAAGHMVCTGRVENLCILGREVGSMQHVGDRAQRSVDVKTAV